MEELSHMMRADFHDTKPDTMDFIDCAEFLNIPPHDQCRKLFYTLKSIDHEKPTVEFFETAEKNNGEEFLAVDFLLAQFDEQYKKDKYAFIPVRDGVGMHNYVIFLLYLSIVELSRRHKTYTDVLMTDRMMPGRLTVAFEKTEEFYNLLLEVGIMSYIEWIGYEFNSLMEPLQFYHNYFQSKRAVKECKQSCLVHAFKECGVPEKVCSDILHFTDHRRFNGVDVYSDVAKEFNLRIKFQYYDKNGNLKIGNSKNGGWYGKIQNKDTITCEIAEIENHTFVNKRLPITKFYLNNKLKVAVYGFMHNWTPQQCFQATKFVGEKCYTDKNKTTPALYIVKKMFDLSTPERMEKVDKYNKRIINLYDEMKKNGKTMEEIEKAVEKT